MKIKRIELVEALEAVKPGLASKELVEQSTCFVFSDGLLLTYNDSIAVSVNSPLPDEIVGAVPAQEFYAFITKLSDDEIDIALSDGKMTIKGKKSTAQIAFNTSVVLPLDELGDIDKVTWNTLPAGFVDGIKFCLFSVSKNMATPALTALHFADHFVESCDNFRATQYNMGTDHTFKDDVLVPASMIKEVIAYSPKAYALTKHWVHFTTAGDAVISCRTLNEKYPEVAPILDVKGDTVVFPAGMAAALDRADVFAETEADARWCTVTIEPNRLTVEATSPTGSVVEELEVEYSGTVCRTFMVQCSCLQQILKALPSAVIGDTKIRFAGASFVHIIALSRPKG